MIFLNKSTIGQTTQLCGHFYYKFCFFYNNQNIANDFKFQLEATTHVGLSRSCICIGIKISVTILYICCGVCFNKYATHLLLHLIYLIWSSPNILFNIGPFIFV